MKPILILLLAWPIVAFVHHTIPKSSIDLAYSTTTQKIKTESQTKPPKVVTAAKVTLQPAPVAPTSSAPAQAVTQPTQAPVAVPASVQAAPQPTTHEELMAAAGIASSDYAAVDYIVSHESGWNPDATEPVTGAHGLPQALPYSKTGCGWDDAVCQLQWANSYAISRYGGWWAAQAYWAVHRNW